MLESIFKLGQQGFFFLCLPKRPSLYCCIDSLLDVAALEHNHELEVSDSFLAQEIFEDSILGHLEGHVLYFIENRFFQIYSDYSFPSQFFHTPPPDLVPSCLLLENNSLVCF